MKAPSIQNIVDNILIMVISFHHKEKGFVRRVTSSKVIGKNFVALTDE